MKPTSSSRVLSYIHDTVFPKNLYTLAHFTSQTFYSIFSICCFFLKYCMKGGASWTTKGKTLIMCTGHILSDTLLLPSPFEDHNIVQELQQVQDIFEDAEKLINQAVTSLVVEITSTTFEPPTVQ